MSARPSPSTSAVVAPRCRTVMVCPATVTVPLRRLRLNPAVSVMVPLPTPVPPALMVIHGVFVVAVHAQLEAAVTPIVCVPAIGPNVTDVVDETAARHAGATAVMASGLESSPPQIEFHPCPLRLLTPHHVPVGGKKYVM